MPVLKAGGKEVPEQVNGVPETPIEDPDIHLQRLLMKEDTTPTWLRVVNDIKELIHPVKLPPLEVSFEARGPQ